MPQLQAPIARSPSPGISSPLPSSPSPQPHAHFEFAPSSSHQQHYASASSPSSSSSSSSSLYGHLSGAPPVLPTPRFARGFSGSNHDLSSSSSSSSSTIPTPAFARAFTSDSLLSSSSLYNAHAPLRLTRKRLTSVHSFTVASIMAQLSLHSNDSCAVKLLHLLQELSLTSVAYVPPVDPLLFSRPDYGETMLDDARLHALMENLQQLPPVATLPLSTHQNAVMLLLLLLSYHAHTRVLICLLKLVSSLSKHLSYWKAHPHGTVMQRINDLLAMSVPLVKRHVLRDELSGLYSTPISPSEKLSKLLRLKRHWLDRLGRIAHRQSVLHMQLTMPIASSNRLEFYQRSCTRYMHSINRMLKGNADEMNDLLQAQALRPQPVSGLFAQAGRSGLVSQQLLTVIVSSIDGIRPFAQWFEHQLKPLRAPSHLGRYWLTYLTLGLGSALSIRRAYTNRDALAAQLVESYMSLAFFVKDHVTDPIKGIYEDLFATIRNRSLMKSAHDNLLASQKALENMLMDYGKEHPDVLQDGQALSARAADLDMNLIMKQYEKDITRPFRSLFFGDLAQAFLIQIQQLKVQSEAAILTLDQLLQANNFNFNLLATIPAMLIGYVMTSGFQSLITRVYNSGRDRRSLLDAVRRRLASIESVCILHLYHASSDEIDTSHDRVRLSEQGRHSLALGELPFLTALESSHLSAADSIDESDEEESDDFFMEAGEEEKEQLPQRGSMEEDATFARWNRATKTRYLSDTAYGHLLLSIHSMPSLFAALEPRDHHNWLRDLALLADPSFTPMQKILCTQKLSIVIPSLASH